MTASGALTASPDPSRRSLMTVCSRRQQSVSSDSDSKAKAERKSKDVCFSLPSLAITVLVLLQDTREEMRLGSGLCLCRHSFSLLILNQLNGAFFLLLSELLIIAGKRFTLGERERERERDRETDSPALQRKILLLLFFALSERKVRIFLYL